MLTSASTIAAFLYMSSGLLANNSPSDYKTNHETTDVGVGTWRSQNFSYDT